MCRTFSKPFCFCLLAGLALLALGASVQASDLASGPGSAASVEGGLSFGGGSRYVLKEGRKKETMLISNDSNIPMLVQTTIDWGDGRASEDVPLAVSRPMLVLEPHESKAVEIYFQGSGLPRDRESFFLLSATGVPRITEPHHNSMAVALRHRFKLFYRPAFASEHVEDVPEKLGWELRKASGAAGAAVVVSNPTLFYTTMTEVQALDAQGGPCGEPLNHIMVAPLAEAALAELNCPAASVLTYQYIGDSGLPRPYRVQLQAGRKSAAQAGEN